MSETHRITTITEWRAIPEPFVADGKTFTPVAVAMYGLMNDVVPIADIDDGSPQPLYAGHVVLWAQGRKA